MKDAVLLAYGLQPFLVSGGPGWFGTDFYDIVGKLAVQDGALPPPQKQALEALQLLMEDRFHLRVHWESKQLTLYQLTIAKGGFKLKEGDDLPENTPSGFERRDSSRLVRKKAPLSSLVTALSAYLGSSVEDHTGLKELPVCTEWEHGETSPASADESDSAMIAALRAQLGLNLERASDRCRLW